MPATLTPIASFARIKPLEAETRPPGEAQKRVTAWDEAAGTVTMAGVKSATGNTKTFDHLAATIPPEASQAHVYDVVAAPLVRRWLEGHDVDLLSYGQTGAGKVSRAIRRSSAQFSAHCRLTTRIYRRRPSPFSVRRTRWRTRRRPA